MTQNADVVVVGAGFAGLTAARDLVRLGYDVVVLEGRDRVGGRSSTTTIAGSPVDLGGTFVGPTQDAVLELAAELGCETVPTHSRGKNLIKWRGRVRAYRSTIPRLSMLELFDVSRIQWRFERISRRVSVAEPWAAAHADSLDDQTLDRWLRSLHAGASTRDLMAIMSRVTWGCEPDQVSMLHAVRYVKAAGGIGRMLDVQGGAQQDRFPGGTQQIALRLADELGARVRLNAVVRRIERHADGTVTVGADGGDVTAKAVIVAIPPAHRAAIDFSPALPAEYEKLAQHWPQGTLSKAYAAYETPFWRANGCSGEALSDEGPVFITFDVSPDDNGPRHPAGLHRPAHLRSAAARGTPRTRTGRLRRPVRRRGAAADRLCRSLLGHRGFRTGRADSGGPSRFMDNVRGLAAQARRRRLLGRHRNRRRVDGLSRRRRPVGPPSGGRGAPGAVGLMVVSADRLDETAKLSVHLVGTLENRAVAAGQLDELGEVGRHPRDVARRDHRQQPVLLAADHQRRHREVVQPDVPVGAQRVDQFAGPAAAARRRRLNEQLIDELGDRRVRVAADGHHLHESLAGPVRRTQQGCRAEVLQQHLRGTHPHVGERRRHRHQLDVPQQVPGGGVDQGDGVGALGHPAGIAFGP